MAPVMRRALPYVGGIAGAFVGALCAHAGASAPAIIAACTGGGTGIGIGLARFYALPANTPTGRHRWWIVHRLRQFFG